jgi:phosphoribosylformylglycinamidine synthase
VHLRVENTDTSWTRAYREGQEIVVPLKSGEGAYAADAGTLAALESGGQVVARYLGNPNGSARDIAGVTNTAGNVVGLMPHPEYATSELTGPGTGGLGFFSSVVSVLTGA